MPARGGDRPAQTWTTEAVVVSTRGPSSGHGGRRAVAGGQLSPAPLFPQGTVIAVVRGGRRAWGAGLTLISGQE